jgi:hypothetical protein
MKTVLELEDLAARAVKAALSQQWAEATTLNQEILDEDEQNVEAANRLARAYQEQGQVDLAKQTYQKVLSIDAYNAIAQKNLAKLEQGGTQASKTVSREVFLEEPGKTRTTKLVEPQKKRLENLASGEKLNLEARHGRLAVITSHGGGLVGYVDDELSSHLLNLMHLGNTYSAHLITASGIPQVFLREVSQSEAASKFVSFARNHTSPPHNSSIKSGLTDDAFVSSDEETDNWDSDNLTDESNSDLPEDDFDSMSLESLRDEEDSEYGGRMRDDY